MPRIPAPPPSARLWNSSAPSKTSRASPPETEPFRSAQGSYYVCTHGIAPNGGGAKVNEWTLLIDFSYPPSSLSDPPSGYNDLFQTNPTNADDADWTINSSGGIGIGAVGYSSAHGYTTKGKYLVSSGARG